MNSDWVAAAVRARALARRRFGAAGCRTVAAQPDLATALTRLDGSMYAERLHDATDLAAAERALDDTTVWQLRVLAGWVPAGSSRLCRTAAGRYERDDIVALARHLQDGRTLTPPHELGTLATAWPQLRTATTLPELRTALRRSPWGEVDTDGTTWLRDTLTLVWWRRLADVAPPARPWAQTAAALLAARLVLVDRTPPPPRIPVLLRPLIGSGWQDTHDLTALRETLPRATHAVLRGLDHPDRLWQGEVRAQVAVETDGTRLLRGALPGPDVVLGAAAVLMVDAWRVRAALAAAARGTGPGEVLDAVA
ncbi:hypothetical protein ACTHAM_000737 [Cellulomonas soli]|uniref:hypothetical protein n=1 Tax=Cellulomonas soli TaxID=931535 RepID=UPI003F875BE9